MTQSTIVRKSFNPFSRQTWVRGWRKIRNYRFRMADRVNARSGWLARRIRWPLGVGSPTAGRTCTSFGWVGSATR